MTREFEKVVCPGCGRKLSAYVPHFGDGSGLRTVRHKANHPGGLRKRTHATRECSASGRIITFNRNLGGWDIDA